METKQKPKQEIEKFKETTLEAVLSRVKVLDEGGGLVIPQGYVPSNALRSAWFMLQEIKDNNRVSVLKSCSRESIANALFNMVISGLNPMKKQCAFIARGGKLQMQRMYAGSIQLARRFGDVKEINAGIVYNNDVFKYAIDPITGRKHITTHEQEAENIDETKIKYVYAVAVFNDGTTDMLPMTMAQIRISWSQGELFGKGPAHSLFPGSMAKKTVINAICKVIIDSSDDSVLITNEEDRQAEIPAADDPSANTGPIIDISSEVVEEKETPVTPTKADIKKVESNDPPNKKGKPNELDNALGNDGIQAEKPEEKIPPEGVQTDAPF